MTIQQKRLLNVGQVKYKTGPLVHDHRPNCVEIVIEDNQAIVVMLRLIGEEGSYDPVLVGRIVVAGRAMLIDPMETDGTSWLLDVPNYMIAIRPHKGEAIFVDPSFRRDLPDDLNRLYAIRRASKCTLIAHTRFMHATPKSHESIRETHATAIRAISDSIDRTERLIAEKEAKYDQQLASR